MREAEEIARRPSRPRTPRPLSAESIEAMEFLAAYEGDFAFLVDLKKCVAADPNWWPTEKQAAAVLKCRASEEKKAGVAA